MNVSSVIIANSVLAHCSLVIGDVELLANGADGSKELVKRTMRPGCPAIFEFYRLTPDTKYIVDIIGPEPLPSARQAFLITQPETRTRDIRFATVSCNNVFRGGRLYMACFN